MSKRPYTFGIKYMHRFPVRYSLIYGWWMTDGYSVWLINNEKEEK